MAVYGYTGADVHLEAQNNDDTLMSSVFDYAPSFGNTPIYIGMDANTDNLSSSSLSQVSLSQRWFDIGSHFAYLQHETPSPTCFAIKETPSVDALIISSLIPQQLMPFRILLWKLPYQFLHTGPYVLIY